MSSGLPHSQLINSQMNAFLSALEKRVDDACQSLSTVDAFRRVYKLSNAAFIALRRLSTPRTPLLSSCAGIARRVPLLVACGQLRPAHVELRRFIECIASFPYFLLHPVEWEDYLSNPSKGFVQDQDKPIAWCAHREVRWYLNYVLERHESDKSGIAKGACKTLERCYRQLSGAVHATLVANSRAALLDPFDDPTPQALASLARVQADVFGAGAVLAVAELSHRLVRMDAVERAWLDWLVGSRVARVFRSAAFLHR